MQSKRFLQPFYQYFVSGTNRSWVSLQVRHYLQCVAGIQCKAVAVRGSNSRRGYGDVGGGVLVFPLDSDAYACRGNWRAEQLHLYQGIGGAARRRERNRELQPA